MALGIGRHAPRTGGLVLARTQMNLMQGLVAIELNFGKRTEGCILHIGLSRREVAERLTLFAAAVAQGG